jgi:hypothetical protein
MASLTELAKTILAAAETIDGYIEKNKLPKPSFDPEAPPMLPFVPEVQGPKMQLETALLELQALVGGPAQAFVHGVFGVSSQSTTLDCWLTISPEHARPDCH